VTPCLPTEKAQDQEMKATILSLCSHFLHGKMFLSLFFFSSSISPLFYPVILNTFPSKLWYYFYYIFLSSLNSSLARYENQGDRKLNFLIQFGSVVVTGTKSLT
jgi:hypothetical protein